MRRKNKANFYNNLDVLYKSVLDNTYDGIYFVNNERKITYWNKGAERISGFSYNDVVGSYCHDNILQHIDEAGNRLCLGGCPLQETIDDGVVREENIYLHHKAGYMVPIKVKSLPLYDENNNITGAVEIFSDNQAVKEQDTINNEFQGRSILDDLTKLPNREYLENAIENKIHDYEHNGWEFCILFFDLDRFKFINDNYGEDVGDALLEVFGKTIKSNTKDKDVIGRWGGEAFVGIIELSNVDKLEKVAEKLRILVKNTTLNINNKILSITVSIGGTVVREGDTAELIIKRAKEYLHESKVNGRDVVTIK